MTLPPELERAIWARLSTGWSGTISIDLMAGEIACFTVSEKTRIKRAETRVSQPANNAGGSNVRHSSRG